MPQIETLVSDIYKLFGPDEHAFNERTLTEFGQMLSQKVGNRINETKNVGTLRLSNLGTPCQRKLWYSINNPEKGETLSVQTRFKFLYGDILEELLLFLAKEAGHTVEGEQDEVSIHGIKGHRDCILDGVVVDVKSASTRSFDKFLNHLDSDTDSFGYLRQLDSYMEGSKDDPRVLRRDVGAFLVIDKQLGRICLDIHPKQDINYQDLISNIRSIISEKTPPPRPYADKPDGKSGNRKLGVECSYCQFKKECWPGVRVFIYSTGPRFLTHVERQPEVDEIDGNGENDD